MMGNLGTTVTQLLQRGWRQQAATVVATVLFYATAVMLPRKCMFSPTSGWLRPMRFRRSPSQILLAAAKEVERRRRRLCIN